MYENTIVGHYFLELGLRVVIELRMKNAIPFLKTVCTLFHHLEDF